MFGEFGPPSEYESIDNIEIEEQIDEKFNRVIIIGGASELKKFILALASEKDQPIDFHAEEIISRMDKFEQNDIEEFSDHGSEILEFGTHFLEIGKAEDFGAITSNTESLALSYFYKDKTEDSEEEKERNFEEIKESYKKIMKDKKIDF